jgi:hypothetical protein
VAESNESDNATWKQFAVAPIPTIGGCILPIKQADIVRVTSGQPYQSDGGSNGIHFGFAASGLEYVDVVAPCGGTVTERRRVDADGAIGRERVSLNIQGQGSPPLNMFVVFEPYSTDATTNDDQDDEVIVQVDDVVEQGDMLGRLVVRDQGMADWFPNVGLMAYRGAPTDSLMANHECPRNFLTPGTSVVLDQLFERLNGEMEPSAPNYPVVPVCQ